MADNMMGTHENDVIFNIDSLREFIKLIKRQGTENIDFYAVSELLQPPGDNLMVSVPTGIKDGNLEPWIELYNDGKRQNAETNLLNYFSNVLEHGLSVQVYQYIPEILERNYSEDEDGISIKKGYHQYKPKSFVLVSNKDDIITTYVTRREYDFETETWVNYPTSEEGNQPDYTQDDFDTKFQLTLESSPLYKEVDGEQLYPMNFYNNLNELLSNLSNKASIQINGKTLWLSMPPAPTGNKPELVFILTQKAKQDLINVLSAYFSYNNQINIRKDMQPITVYQKEPIDNPDNEPWWKFIYTKYNGNMIYEDGSGNSKYYTEFVEDELKVNPGKIVVVRKIHPWQNNITNSEAGYDINIKSGRHLYIQAGSLLKFNPGQSTEEKDLIDDYWTDTTPGTFSIDENDGQKAHIITIRGFENGDFNNHDSYPVGPIIGYIKESDIPENANNDGAYKINDSNYNLTDEQLKKLRPFPDDEYSIPVYWNNKGSLTTNVINTDIINADTINTDIINADQGNFNSITVGGGNGIEFGQDLLVTSTTEAQRLPNDPNQGNIVNNKDNLIGSIKTLGGIAAGKSIKGYRIYAAVFNDYAECRKTIDLEPGRVVVDNDDGSLSCANSRLLPGAQIISDTYGNLIGEMPNAQTPIAVSGRVLVYPYQNRNNYHAGMAVCSAPNGTVDIMTREEIKEYPDCIVGIVSEIPNYEKWGTNQVNVNNRIWIRIK